MFFIDLSIAAFCCNFWIFVSAVANSSSVISLFFCSVFALSIPSLLIALIATFDSSAVFLISFTNSFLLSSVNSGKLSLITLPSLFGFIPISAIFIAFSISLNKLISINTTHLLSPRLCPNFSLFEKFGLELKLYLTS